MKRTMNTSTTYPSTRVTKAQIVEFLDGLPDDAKVEMSTYSGDQRDPRDTGSVTLRASWVVGS